MTREEWLLERTFTGADIDPDTLAARKAAAGTSISVVIPALNVAETVGSIVEAVRTGWMGPGGLVDELVVIDSASSDGTARLATEAGAIVVQDHEVLAAQGTRRGKGEAMWKSLAATSGDIVAWIDGDIEAFDAAFVPGLVAPLVDDATIRYVKAYYRRPLGESADGGGRVTEICARPLINRFFPELAGFVQPLSGEAAGRRSLLETLPFFCGYAVEIGLLIDILRAAGLPAMAQVDLGERRHRNQPTPALGRMAYEITHALLDRGGVDDAELESPDEYVRPERDDAGGLALERSGVSLGERPPMAGVARGAAAA